MKHITAGLVAIALVAMAVSIGVAAYAFANTSTSEPEGGSPSIRGEMRGYGYHNMPEEYVLNTALPSVPDKLMVYKTKANVTRADVTSLAERLGMNGSIKEESYRFIVTDGQRGLYVGKSDHNYVYYEDTSRRRKGNGRDESGNPPSDEEAVAIATKFLNDTGLMPEDAVPLKVERTTSNVMVSFATDETHNLPDIAGFRMSVEVGGNGNIISLNKDWPEYEPYKVYSVITPEEALEELKKSGITTRQRNVTTATINKVWFGYHCYKDYEEGQRYLKPIYKFKGEAKGEIDGHTETKPFSKLIYALSDDYPIPPAKKYVLNTTLPSVPDKLMVYKTAEPKVSKADVASLAERMGLNGSVREADWMFLVTDGQYDLDVSKISGAMVYTDTSRSMTGNDKDKPENLPSDDEAIEIARKFLEERGLMPEDAVFRRVGHRVLKAIKGGKTIGIGWEAIEVRFGRRINGIPVDGAGITVGVGGYGDVIELWKKWREYEPYKEYPIITPEEAFEEMKREGVDVSLRNVSTATVNNVYLAYYSKCALDEQTYLKPVYVFEGDAEGKSAECNETGIVQYRNETAHFKQFIVAAPELGGLYAEQ